MDEARSLPHSSCPYDIKGDIKLKSEEEEVSYAERAALEGIVWRKIDAWVLPLSTCFFLLAFLDRSNIANARVAGLQESLGISNYQYTVILTVASVPYIIIELPYTLFLKYVGPDLMFPVTVALWGVIAASQGFVNNYAGLLACRFFLGLAEGGIVPGIMVYLSCFYPRKKLQIRNAIFFATASLSGAFSGLLAAAIDHIDGKGGKPGWAWIFILEGLFTFVFGVISFFLFPRSPERACFLTEKERAHAISTLKQAGSVSEDDDKDKFSWAEVVRAVRSPHIWFLAVVFCLSGAIVGGVANFEPTIVVGLGYAGNHAQLMSVPPFVVSFVLSIISAIISDRYQCRGYVVLFFSLLQAIGFIMYYVSSSNHVRYGSLFFSVPGAYGVAPALMTWMVNNSTPYVRRATASAISITMTQVGGILPLWLLGWVSPAPNYTSATIVFIAMSVGMMAFAAINLVYLRRENRLKAEKRERMRKEDEPEGLGDRSAWFVYSL